MIIEIILWAIGSYLFVALCTYCWAVAKTYEILGIWDFKIYEDRIGVCSYPKWLLGWAYKTIGEKDK